MATVLLVWEMGAGTGHAMHTAPIVNALVRRGHRVVASMRDPAVAAGVFDPAIEVLPGAFRCERIGPKRLTDSFADILWDFGFADEETLRSIAGAWRNLLRLVNADVVIFDHAPTVLLAARGLAVRKVVLGPGFNVLPDTSPLPSLRPWAQLDPELLRQKEGPLVACVNRVLAGWGENPIERIGQLYGEVDETLLLTFSELDCYAEQRGAGVKYWGPVLGPGGGIEPEWPQGEGVKVYAYLRPFNRLPDLMKLLAESELATLVYAPHPGLAEQLMKDFARPTLRVETRRLDMKRVADQCGLAIGHAGHGMVWGFLLNGLPSLHVPLHTEMGLNARAVRKLGAGVDASADDPAVMRERLDRVIAGRETYAEGAGSVARKYGGYDGEERIEGMVGRVVG